jgi:hypothetical protein
MTINIKSKAYLFVFSLLFSLTGCIVVPVSYSKSDSPTPWSKIRRVEMKGDLKIFWGVVGGNNSENNSQAIAHGFKIIGGLNPYGDYGNYSSKREDINLYLQSNRDNPWKKPIYFEKTVQKNLNAVKNSVSFKGVKLTAFYNDIEFSFETNINKAWNNPEVRKASGAKNIEAFKGKYFREWASWFNLPSKWAKQKNPNQLVGLYGRQVFIGDYNALRTNNIQKIDDSYRLDTELWQYIDPYVDFYISNTYILQNDPGSIYYMAANVEGNYLRSRRFSRKPVYPFVWMRYHNINKKEGNREIEPYMAEAAAIVPFFSGAKGLVVWGWEPKLKGQYYHNLPIFMNSLSRIADLSEKISKAKLIIDEPADVSWRKKSPLIRKLQVSNQEWIVMAVYPWQSDREEKKVNVNLGGRSLKLTINGRHTEVYHLRGKNLKRLSITD